MKLLLDTCTFLWLILGDPALSASACQLFADPANQAFLSAVSAWEISVKHRLGRLPLPAPPDQFVPAQRQAHGVFPLALEEQEALREGGLPGLHKDPFDRMLICQALVHDLVVLTPDPLIRQNPVRTMW